MALNESRARCNFAPRTTLPPAIYEALLEAAFRVVAPPTPAKEAEPKKFLALR